MLTPSAVNTTTRARFLRRCARCTSIFKKRYIALNAPVTPSIQLVSPKGLGTNSQGRQLSTKPAPPMEGSNVANDGSVVPQLDDYQA